MKVTEYRENGGITERNIPSLADLPYYYGEGRMGREGVRKIQYCEKGKIETVTFEENK